jgi:hypothetical protein
MHKIELIVAGCPMSAMPPTATKFRSAAKFAQNTLPRFRRAATALIDNHSTHLFPYSVKT